MAKKTSRAHGSTPAVTALEEAGVPHTLHAYEHDPASELGYAAEAAVAMGVDPAQVYKTLVADVDGRLVVAVVPGDRLLDLKALARAAGGKKATMAPAPAAERATGYVVGGISPLGQRQPHRTFVDSSAEQHDVVYVSGGRRGLDVGLSPADLVRLTGARLAPLAR
ncbi:Cys-tRNA(Pro) deacylase [Xylanimonas oleitrophica]|uniref:Cys-tRNA(Pro)/Cys-tRNA(Cys) deacylase n=1 Tax=Xylanimonas oleitrophica TaxID=2607479 RepID=A0A2W5WM92_9MICO|nr:Cys-tRNA(Pro) deacylase [Xylanimonas oleitrophica]PZR52310.1 Cys-tRNA(Pro) deacylase [Xylanimonas oleitrophica]